MGRTRVVAAIDNDSSVRIPDGYRLTDAEETEWRAAFVALDIAAYGIHRKPDDPPLRQAYVRAMQHYSQVRGRIGRAHGEPGYCSEPSEYTPSPDGKPPVA
jgi:hypothetical protein